MEAGRSSKRPTERGFTNSEGHQPLWHSLLCPHLCLIKHQPAAINTRLHTETQCTHIGMHGMHPLCILHHLWLECLRRNVGKRVIYPSIHLRLHSSLLPPSPLPFIMKKKKNQSFNLELHVRRYHTRYYRLFSQKLSCVGDLDCFTGQFTSPDCSMTYPIRPHIWRSDGKQIVILALQTFLGGKSFVWNQDVFQWKDPLFSLAG